jgi:hypothetical protein
MKIIKYENSWSEKWNHFIDHSKNGSFLFKRNFMEYHSDRFEDHSLLVVDDQKIIAILPANIKGPILYSHQGLTYGGLIVGMDIKMPIILQAFKYLLQFLHEIGVNKLILKNIPHIYHRYPADEIEWALIRIKAVLYRIDSTLTIDNRFPLPYQERRNRSIKKAEKISPIIKTNESDGFDKFWQEVLVPNMLKKHNLKPVHNLAEIKMLASQFPANIKQYNIYINNQIMAGCTMFLNQTVAHAQYISGTDEGRSNGCLDYLFNYLIKEEYSSYPYFDFGNSNEDAGTKINFGLMDWKEGFGARAVSHDFYEINTANFDMLENIIHNG